MKNKQQKLQFSFALVFTLIMGSSNANTNNEFGSNLQHGGSNSQVQMNSSDNNYGSDLFLNHLVSRADFIFKGKLLEKSEALSMEGIPYTFVTYQIDELIAGEYYQNTITLKFVGGEFPNGNRLSATNSPEVSVGEESILMVQQTRDTGCDFVDCEHGRFVLKEGNVLAANEAAIVIDTQGGIDYISFAARIKGTHKASLEKSNIAKFISYLKNLDQASSSLRTLSRTTVTNTDKRAPFKAYSALTNAKSGPKVPKTINQKQPLQLKGNAHDQWEVEQLRKNNGNPVLSSSYSNEKN